MKMKQLFFVGLMAIAFAGCSGDNAYDNGGGNPIEGDQFMAVKLVMSGDAASTRAFGSAGFEAGTEDEVGVTKATFLFFDGETQVADPYETSNLDPWTGGTTESVDKVSASVIVLSNAIKNPTSIVAILNPSTDINITRSTTLTELKNIKSDYSKYTTAKNFVMSNSVYNAGGKTVIGAPCTADNIRKTQEEAKQHPVKIAVEKVVAKVNVKQGDEMAIKTNTVDGNDNVAVDGKTKKVTAEITGWWLDNTNSTSYLIKKLETSYASIGSDTWWNDEVNRRSYWATPAVGSFNHYTYNTANTSDKYCLENTNQDTPTQIVVAATLKVDGQAMALVKYLSVVYTASGFEEELTKLLSNKYYTKTGTGSYTALTKADLVFTYDVAVGKSYEAQIKVELKGGVSVFTSTTPSDSDSYTQADTATLNTDLDNLKRTVQYWKDGKTYYYLPIVHNGDITVTPTTPPAAATHGLYGVIRNHLYKLTIKSINGLGTPVPNPDEPTTPITPEKPEDDNSYIAAQIEILKYKVVTQDVDLGL
ncbi:Mfa1 family fimbria major subunit [Bacteroides sp. KG123]|uniref:Mfa1 family fimbria major subunit n=1 Tax=unclassified Bacteroides TaxID=2646097 RepID=UPI003D7FD46F